MGTHQPQAGNCVMHEAEVHTGQESTWNRRMHKENTKGRRVEQGRAHGEEGNTTVEGTRGSGAHSKGGIMGQKGIEIGRPKEQDGTCARGAHSRDGHKERREAVSGIWNLSSQLVCCVDFQANICVFYVRLSSFRFSEKEE